MILSTSDLCAQLLRGLAEPALRALALGRARDAAVSHIAA